MAVFSFTPRDPHEHHRVASTLELLFDLAAVIAVEAAATGLHHGIAAGHFAAALPAFVGAFFMIWWSWMNYTWFASAYDDGSSWFRILSMTAMFGALMIAAGLPAVFAGSPLHLSLAGFVVMRLAMAAFWFGAAAGDPEHRRTALGYGVGIVAMQVYWVVVLSTVAPGNAAYFAVFGAGMIGELSVPALSEGRWGVTNWHRHHIIERYGLLNIIVLGECFVSIAAMLVLGEEGAPTSAHGVMLAVAAAAITFALAAVYFTGEDHLVDDRLSNALPWGYGHFFIFASGAAIGGGFAVLHEVEIGHAAIGMRVAGLAIGVPIAIYMLGLWVIRDRHYRLGRRSAVLPVAAVAAVLTPIILPQPLPALAVLTIVAAILRRTPTGVQPR